MALVMVSVTSYPTCERLRGRDCDRIASVHAHGIQVLDGADDDDVVVQVTHHLQLVLLPSQQRLLDQNLAGQGRSQPCIADLLELLLVVRDTASSAAQRESWTDNDREVADLHCNWAVSCIIR
jgi:hypothetical protein